MHHIQSSSRIPRNRQLLVKIAVITNQTINKRRFPHICSTNYIYIAISAKLSKSFQQTVKAAILLSAAQDNILNLEAHFLCFLLHPVPYLVPIRYFWKQIDLVNGQQNRIVSDKSLQA
ncbi:hypothetical protein D3C78_1327790 [compost metagenome]